MQSIYIPEKIIAATQHSDEGPAWLEQLPEAIVDLAQRWSLRLAAPFEAEASCSWVAACTRADGSPAVLKLGMPHMEALHEVEGLIFWAGDPTVLVLEADVERNAILLEQCQPGIPLRQRPEPEQDEVIASLLKRLWRVPPDPHPFRPLAEMATAWAAGSLAVADEWPDAGLAQEGIRLFEELPRTTPHEALLATDLHAGNVLQAQREPWLVIDPKPFFGDVAYDATQHLLNCRERLEANPADTIRRFADLLEVDYERIKLWTFARLAAEAWGDLAVSQVLARRVMG